MKIFALFFYGWILMFSLLFQILGMQVPPNDDNESDYKNVNVFMVYFLQTYRNSIGDIAAPDYSFWTARGTQSTGDWYSSRFMIFLIWFFWFANQFFVLIILLNFLIAIISQKYEQVMA